MNHREVLKNIYLFKNITASDLEALAGISSVENFAPNDEVFAQGDRAFALYLMKHGSVKIMQKTKGGDMVSIANLGVGAHFGEMAFLDGAPRSASAVAAEKSEIVVVPYEKLTQLVKERPEFAVKVYKEMAHFLAGRLRVTTSDLSFSREKNLSHF